MSASFGIEIPARHPTPQLPGNTDRAPILRQIEEAGRTRGIKVRPFAVRNPDEFTSAFDAATRARVDALVVEEGPLMYMERTRIVEFAAANHLPAIYGVREFVILGGLISYGPDLA